MTECFDGTKLRRLLCGIDPKEDAHGGGKDGCHYDRGNVDLGINADKKADQKGSSDADGNADETAKEGDDGGLREELQHDGGGARP